LIKRTSFGAKPARGSPCDHERTIRSIQSRCIFAVRKHTRPLNTPWYSCCPLVRWGGEAVVTYYVWWTTSWTRCQATCKL